MLGTAFNFLIFTRFSGELYEIASLINLVLLLWAAAGYRVLQELWSVSFCPSTLKVTFIT